MQAGGGLVVAHSPAKPRDAIARMKGMKEEHMIRFAHFVKSLRRHDEGQDLLEYALLIALIAIVCAAAVAAAGLKVNDVFTAVAAAIPT